MAPPTEADLDKLKQARSNIKRAVTISYNLLKQYHILDCGLSDQDKVIFDRLKLEFEMFTASHDDYISGLEKKNK